MKPSKEYKENLKNNIITSDMLYDCIYSVNKRAKNYRDLKNFYNRYYYSNLNKMKEYKQLEIERIDDDFYTQGKEIQDLISIQFVKKVIDKIKEGNFIYQK